MHMQNIYCVHDACVYMLCGYFKLSNSLILMLLICMQVATKVLEHTKSQIYRLSKKCELKFIFPEIDCLKYYKVMQVNRRILH